MAQLSDYGTDYFQRGLCYPIYGGKHTSVLRYGCEVLERKHNQIFKRVRFYKYLFITICLGKEFGVLDSEMYSVRRHSKTILSCS